MSAKRITRATLHLDEDGLAWYRQRRSGWQHSINHALQRYMQDVECEREAFADREK